MCICGLYLVCVLLFVMPHVFVLGMKLTNKQSTKVAIKEVSRGKWERAKRKALNGNQSSSSSSSSSSSRPRDTDFDEGEWWLTVDGNADESESGDDNSSTQSQSQSRLARSELLKEAAILATLRHPNVVLFYGVAMPDAPDEEETNTNSRNMNMQGSYFFVTELCETTLNHVERGWKNRRVCDFKYSAGSSRSGSTTRRTSSSSNSIGGHSASDGGDGDGVSDSNDCHRELWEMLMQIAAGMQYLHR
jgi:hypothetical protein